MHFAEVKTHALWPSIWIQLESFIYKCNYLIRICLFNIYQLLYFIIYHTETVSSMQRCASELWRTMEGIQKRHVSHSSNSNFHHSPTLLSTMKISNIHYLFLSNLSSFHNAKSLFMNRWKEETIHILNIYISVSKQDTRAICMLQKDSTYLNLGFFFTIASRENKQKWAKISLASLNTNFLNEDWIQLQLEYSELLSVYTAVKW